MQDDDIMLPEGYTEGMDFFAMPDTPQEDTQGQDQAAEPAPTTEPAPADPAPTPEPDPTPDVVAPDQTAAPTTEPPDDAGDKLRFKAKVDRNEVDVEVTKDELPSIYQRAQVTDRVQQRLQQLQPKVDQAEQLARTLGYQNMDDMLQNAAGRFRENTVQRLVSKGVDQEVAETMAEFKLSQGAAPKQPPAQAQPPAPPERNFGQELAELRRVFPESAQLSKFPDEVSDDAIKRGVPLVAAYAVWTAKQQTERAQQAERELQVLRQNQQAAEKAPVKGATGGGVAAQAADDFLKGFESD